MSAKWLQAGPGLKSHCSSAMEHGLNNRNNNLISILPAAGSLSLRDSVSGLDSESCHLLASSPSDCLCYWALVCCLSLVLFINNFPVLLHAASAWWEAYGEGALNSPSVEWE